jgi:glutathione S-transferase
MKLLVSGTSPYARKCRVLVRELGLLERVEEVDAHPFEDGAALLAANPLGRVPCLIMDDGRALTESTLIADWLNTQSDAGWARDINDRRLEALGAGVLDLAVGRRVEMVRDEAIFSAYWIGRRERGIDRALDQLDGETIGNVRSIGALTIAIALDYLDFRYPESEWRRTHPALTKLHSEWKDRESFALTRPLETA